MYFLILGMSHAPNNFLRPVIRLWCVPSEIIIDVGLRASGQQQKILLRKETKIRPSHHPKGIATHQHQGIITTSS
jgi:hypothetical protein